MHVKCILECENIPSPVGEDCCSAIQKRLNSREKWAKNPRSISEGKLLHLGRNNQQ